MFLSAKVLNHEHCDTSRISITALNLRYQWHRGITRGTRPANNSHVACISLFNNFELQAALEGTYEINDENN